MVIWTIARKDLRLLLRDRRAIIILLAMPFIFMLMLGVSLGEGFGQKPDDRLRFTLVDEDLGQQPALVRQACSSLLEATPQLGLFPSAVPPALLGAATQGWMNQYLRPPTEPWASVVRRDLEQTAELRVEVVPSREEAVRLVRQGKRAAILVFGPEFSDRVTRCSFLADGINPFYRDGVKLAEIDAELLRDPTQLAAAGIIEQVGQVTLLRVLLPWMIGRAFEKLSEPFFLTMLLDEVPLARKMLPDFIKPQLGIGIQAALKRLFPKYNLTGKTWAALTKSEPRSGPGAGSTQFAEDGGSGLLKRGAMRYQILVPSYTVMFAFFLVLTVGWLFVSERRQGTLKRLRAAPLSRRDILFGKLLPCFLLSLAQGAFLLLAGKLVFGLKWGPPEWSLGQQLLGLIPVVVSTSFAAMGLALLVASLAQTETQVAIYGTLLVLVLAGVSGCLMPRELMPEEMKRISLATPHAWALDAYAQLFLNPQPEIVLVAQSCFVLLGFGLSFVLLAWYFLKLD